MNNEQKLNKLVKHIQSAGLIEENDEEYSFAVMGDKYRFINNEETIEFSAEDIINSKFEDGTLVIKDRCFNFYKVTEIAPPIDFLSFDEIYSLFEEIADSCNGEVYSNGYSGRFMFNKRCFGIVTKDIGKCIVAATERGITNNKSDDMGLSSIIYWPNIEYNNPKDEE